MLLATSLVLTSAGASGQQLPVVELRTNMGNIVVELRPDKAPRSVESFLYHTLHGFYEGTVFHRVIPDFMIQGGGHTVSLALKEPLIDRVPLEDGNGLSNTRGTIAMARTGDPNSANSQFYINVIDNTRLDKHRDMRGYAVFGRVVAGLNVADRIANVRTGRKKPFKSDVPKEPVVIQSVNWINIDKSSHWPALRNVVPTEEQNPQVQVNSGSCFVISDDGVIVTANHVIADAEVIEVQLSDGRALPAAVFAHSASNDIAILDVKSSTPNYLSIAPSSAVQPGDSVFTFGYPAVNILGDEMKFSEGSVSSMSGLMGEASHMQVSVPIQPGNSGGPLIAEDGRVVGVILSTASVENFYSVVGTLPQGVNWAVKSEYVKLLAPETVDERRYSDRRSAIQAARAAACRVMAE